MSGYIPIISFANKTREFFMIMPCFRLILLKTLLKFMVVWAITLISKISPTLREKRRPKNRWRLLLSAMNKYKTRLKWWSIRFQFNYHPTSSTIKLKPAEDLVDQLSSCLSHHTQWLVFMLVEHLVLLVSWESNLIPECMRVWKKKSKYQKYKVHLG